MLLFTSPMMEVFLKFKSILVFITSLLILGAGFISFTKEKALFIDDSRLEPFQVTEPFFNLTQSTAILWDKSKMHLQGDSFYLDTIPLKEKSTGILFAGEPVPLCESVPYQNQPTGGYCSAFLIAPDLMVTAGHCVAGIGFGAGPLECPQLNIVFDYALRDQTDYPDLIAKKDVYECKEVLEIGYNYSKKIDWAILRLDRPVLDRLPLPLRQSGVTQVGDSLVIIGHPTSLPTKIADNAKVLNTEPEDFPKEYFLTSIDALKGNSGSVIYNIEDGVVDGILVRGSSDYIQVKSNGQPCLKLNICEASEVGINSNCMGSEVSRITPVVKALKEIQNPVDNKSELISPTNGVIHAYENDGLIAKIVFDDSDGIKQAALLNTPPSSQWSFKALSATRGQIVLEINSVSIDLNNTEIQVEVLDKKDFQHILYLNLKVETAQIIEVENRNIFQRFLDFLIKLLFGWRI